MEQEKQNEQVQAKTSVPQGPNVPRGDAAPTGGVSVHRQSSSNPFLDYADRTSSRNIVGKLLKFSKGDYLAGSENEEIAQGKSMIANMDELLIGWIRWEEQRPVEQFMGRIIDGFVPPLRDQLGYGYQEGMTNPDDADQSEWEMNAQGQTRDPWQYTNYLVMKDPDETDPMEGVYTFAVSSLGGKNCISDLCKSYGRKMAMHEKEYPIVTLRVGSYPHQNKEFGRIKYPVLPIIGWVPKSVFGDYEDVSKKLAAPARKIDDDIPF
jgi:hypothetical protein